MFKIFKPHRINKQERQKQSSMPHRSLNFDFRALESSKKKFTEKPHPQLSSVKSQTSRFLNSSGSRASDRTEVVNSDNFYSLLKSRMSDKNNIYSSQKSLRKTDSLIQKYLTKGQKNTLNFMKHHKTTVLKPDIDHLNITQELYNSTDRKGSGESKRFMKSMGKSSTRKSQNQSQAKQKSLLCSKGNQNLEDSLSSSQQGRSQYCHIVIVLDLGEERRQISVRYRVKKIKGLVDFLKNYIKQFYVKNSHLKDYKQIVAFETVDYNLQLDYYLTLQNEQALFLNGETIILRPVYSVKQPVINLNSFNILQCIGNGGFSTVYLCRFKENGKFYAMKVISKSFIVKNQKKKIVMNERNIMVDLRGKLNIANLYYSFEAKQYIVFVMQYYEGGELFNLVKRFRKMNEKTARFYITEVLIGLEQIHQLGIVYRDFKPENIMIDMDGHACIADFGLAKPHISNIDDRAYSFCGSPEYMPPEMILKEGHSLPVDFYCLGALLYELVTGLPPFYNTDSQKIYDGTLNQQLTFPDHVILSFQLQDLLLRLLCKNEKHRLGSNYGVQQIFSHPWFKSINKEDFILRKVKPPVDFKRIEDLRFNIDEMREENQKQMKQILRNQKLQDQVKYLKLMNGFYYDYRLTEMTEDQNGDEVKANESFGQFKKRKTHLSIDKTKNNSESIALTNCTRRSQNSLLSGNQYLQFTRHEKSAILKTLPSQRSGKDIHLRFNRKSPTNIFIQENSYFKPNSPQLNSSHKSLLRKINNLQI